MYIKNIKLQNYRNYENLDLDLGRKTTVLIGKNGSGKTSLIEALKVDISILFSSKQIRSNVFFDGLPFPLLKFRRTDVRYNFTPEGLVYNFPCSTHSVLSFNELSDNDAVLSTVYGPDSIYKGKNDALSVWDYYFLREELPVFSGYSATYSRYARFADLRSKEILNQTNTLPRNYAYRRWDNELEMTPAWYELYRIKWFNARINGNVDDDQYVSSINRCFITFTEPLVNCAENSDIVLEEISMKPLAHKELEMLFIFKNIPPMTFASLPDGYRRVFSIVFDIANRSYLLNKDCNPEGIVFIDEIDSHLHPSLAQEILDRFKRTFPRLQFIVTTHSPLVISNFKQDESDNLIYDIVRNGEGKPEARNVKYSYGLDYNSLLTDLMGTSIRNSLLEQLLQAYRYWDAARKDVFKQQILKQIVELVGEDSKIVKELKQ